MNWKKYMAGIAGMLFLLTGIIRIPVQAEETSGEPENLYARSAVLMDADSGRVLFGKEEQVVRPMASTTKIMTCILALEEMEEGETGTVSANAAGQPKVRLGVKEGEEYRLEDLLYALMLESYNDSAVVIAESLSGSVEEFADQMNEKAREIGCRDTHFITPNGLDAEDAEGVHATTAEDLALILRYCIRESPEKEAFLAVTQTRDYTFTDVSGKRSFSCQNHNAFLDMMEGALTGKTGFTADAGYCYVGALSQDDRTFIVALLGCGWPGHKNYKWEDTRKLMEYGLANYAYRKIGTDDMKAGQEDSLKIPVENGADPKDPYKRGTVVRASAKDPESFRLLMRKDEKVECRTEIPDALAAPVKRGDQVGKICFLLDGEEVGSCKLTARESVEAYDLGTVYHALFPEFLLGQ